MADIGCGRARHASKITRLREPRHQKREKFGIVGVGGLCSKSEAPCNVFQSKKMLLRQPLSSVPVGRRSVAKIVPFVLQLSLQRITEGSPSTGWFGEDGNYTLYLCSNPYLTPCQRVGECQVQ